MYQLYDTNILNILIDCFEFSRPVSNYLDQSTLSQLIKYGNKEIREWIAKALSCENNALSITWLSELANDSDPMVRLEALDSLSAFTSAESYTVLCLACKDTDPLVRSLAFSGIGTIGKEIDPIDAKFRLQIAERMESNDLVRVHLYKSLYTLGEPNAIHSVIMLFNSSDYHVKCSVVRVLGEMINKDNISQIFDFWDNLQPLSQYPVAVNDAIAELEGALRKWRNTVDGPVC